MENIFGDTKSLTPDEIYDRKKSLRESIFFIGACRLLSTFCHMVLYFLVRANCEGHMSHILQIMTLVVIPLVILSGLVLVTGASKQAPGILEVGVWLCLIMASYNTVLGIMGFYTIYLGQLSKNTVIIVILVFLTISLFFVFYDLLILLAYNKLLKT